MTTHILYGAKRDGKLHPATICNNPKHAMDLARVYCHNAVADRPDQNSNYGQSAWDHLIETGRIQVVELYCRETTTGRECEMTPEEKRKRQQAANKNLGKNIPTEIVRECLELYRQGAPIDMLREKMGIHHVQLVFRNRGYKYPPLKERRRLIKQWRINQVDWSPIADIKPVRGMRGYAMFTAEEQLRIKQFMADNYNNIAITDVERFFNIPFSAVNRIMESKEPRARRNPIRNISDEDFRELHKRHMAGESIRELSKSVGCAQATLSRQFKKMGLEIICHRLEPRKAAAPKIRQMFADGKSTKEIAETLGISIWVVREERKLLRKDIELAERKAGRRGATPVVSKRPHRRWMDRI